MIHMRQQRLVHSLHGRPVRTVRIRHVQVVALIPPPFVEDLTELLTRIDVGAQHRREATGAGRRHRAVGIHQVERPLRPTGAIQQLAAVGADDVLRDTGHERHGTPRGQLKAMQRIAANVRDRATGASAGNRHRLEEEHGTRHTGAQSTVVALSHTRHRDDTLLNAIKVDAHGTRGRRHRRPRAVGTCFRRRRRRRRRHRAIAASAGRFFVALRQQRRHVALGQHGEIQRSRFRTIVLRHIQQRRVQREIRRGEKPQVLAACIPRRCRRVGQAVGDLLDRTRLRIVHKDRAEQRLEALRIRHVARVGTPDRHDRTVGHEVRIGVGHLGLSARDINHPDTEVRILKRDLPAVRRPARRIRTARLRQRDLPTRAQSVLRRDHQRVLTAGIAEVRQ